jgi:hypothetical protein
VLSVNFIRIRNFFNISTDLRMSELHVSVLEFSEDGSVYESYQVTLAFVYLIPV